MSELRRLLDSDATEVERQLLRAGDLEQPDSKMIQRAAAALGVSASVATVAQVSAAGTATAAGKAAAGAAPLALSIGKWLAVAGIVGGAGFGTYQVMREPEPARPSAPAKLAEPQSPAVPQVAAAPESQVIAPAPALPATPAAEAAKPTAHAEPKSGYTSVADEVKAIGQIRSAVSRGEAKQALGLLDAYDRRFAGGALGQEATMLRVQALQLAGDKKAAQALGERFIEANPKSPHQERVRGLLGGSAGSPAKPGAH